MTQQSIDDAVAEATEEAAKATAIATFFDNGVAVNVVPRQHRDSVFLDTYISSKYRDDEDGSWKSSIKHSKQQLYVLRRLIDKALDAIDVAEAEQRAQRKLEQ